MNVCMYVRVSLMYMQADVSVRTCESFRIFQYM